MLAVILGHTESAFLDQIPGNALFRNGGLGVAVFFVISGFLITHLLIREADRTGSISLRRFYLRRTFRIFPPFYVFLLVVAVLNAYGWFQLDFRSLLAAATYTWNYVPDVGGFPLAHTWSLSLEEQFYLLWPLAISSLGQRRSLWIAVAVICLSPFSRLATYFLWPEMRGHIGMMLHTRLDTIMTGSLLALLTQTPIWSRCLRIARHPATILASLVFLLVGNGLAIGRWHGAYTLSIGFSVENLAIAALLVYVVYNPATLAGRFLNLAPLRHIGMISYSLYLWQQIFTGIYTRSFPLNLLWIFLCAELSFWLVERPSFRLRDLVQRRLFPVTG